MHNHEQHGLPGNTRNPLPPTAHFHIHCHYAATTRWGLLLTTVLVLLFLPSGCGRQEETSGYRPQYSEEAPDPGYDILLFGVHPLHNPLRLHEVYGPLTDYLNAHLSQHDIRIRLEASRSYAEYDEKLYAGKFHFALPNPYQTWNSLERGYQVFAKMGEDEQFRGIFLIRRDSGIESVADLKGRAVSFPAPTALAATMMPLHYLATHGLDVGQDIEKVFAGSQESSIMNAYLGNTAAGATWPPPWIAFQERHPDFARELELKWQSAPLINNGLVARADVAPQLVEAVRDLLCSLQEDEEGRAILANIPLKTFEPATDADYRVVADFLENYQEAVGPLPGNE